MKIGQEVTVTLEGKIIKESNAHGECYLVEFAQKDYSAPRRLWIDREEITHPTRPTPDELEDAAIYERWAESLEVSDPYTAHTYRNWAKYLREGVVGPPMA